ncbi:hypothetical protein GW17_00059922, partial [Ensete ventricosum]
RWLPRAEAARSQWRWLSHAQAMAAGRGDSTCKAVASHDHYGGCGKRQRRALS